VGDGCHTEPPQSGGLSVTRSTFGNDAGLAGYGLAGWGAGVLRSGFCVWSDRR